jgi:hypothetical protein
VNRHTDGRAAGLLGGARVEQAAEFRRRGAGHHGREVGLERGPLGRRGDQLVGRRDQVGAIEHGPAQRGQGAAGDQPERVDLLPDEPGDGRCRVVGQGQRERRVPAQQRQQQRTVGR